MNLHGPDGPRSDLAFSGKLFPKESWNVVIRDRLNVNAKLLVSAALLFAVLALFAYVPVRVGVETSTWSSTLPCYTTATLVPFGSFTFYTLSLCTCTVLQSQSYASRYVSTLTCPVTTYTSVRAVESPLTSSMPWLPILLLIIAGVCLVGGVYAVIKRDGKA